MISSSVTHYVERSLNFSNFKFFQAAQIGKKSWICGAVLYKCWFLQIKALLSGELTGKPFHVQIDSLYGATGPYVSKILGEKLGANANELLHTTPKPDFGGGHPDPNLTYAHHLVEAMAKGEHDFGAAFDGDGVSSVVLSALLSMPFCLLCSEEV